MSKEDFIIFNKEKVDAYLRNGMSFACIDSECFNITQNPSGWKFFDECGGFLCPTCTMDYESSYEGFLCPTCTMDYEASLDLENYEKPS